MRSSHCIASGRARITLPDVPATLTAHRHVAEIQCQYFIIANSISIWWGACLAGQGKMSWDLRTCAG